MSLEELREFNSYLAYAGYSTQIRTCKHAQKPYAVYDKYTGSLLGRFDSLDSARVLAKSYDG